MTVLLRGVNNSRLPRRGRRCDGSSGEKPVPLYEYECGACGHRFEKIRKYSDPPVKKCPKCKGTVRKLASAPAIQFKGAGWYITDYARKSTPGKDEKEEKDAKEKKAGEEKPAKKDEKAAPASSAKPPKKKTSED